ncbi:MAG: tetratricopeptide repeat protein [Ectothiorhodospiraceae bacterium]
MAGLNQAPGDARLERLRVQALFEMGETDAALEAMAALVETQEDNWRLHLDYARRLQQAGRDDAARSVFGRLRDTWPEEPQVLYSAAMLSLEVGYREQAQTYLEDLLELGSRRGAAHYFLGRIAEDQGRVRDALNRYERVESGDYRSRAGLRRAVVLGREGRVARAREAFEAHRARFPEQAPRAFLMEAQMLRELGRREDAATVYEQGLAEHPDNADLRYGRGLLRAVSGDIDGAEADFRHILEADPDHVDALNALGYTLVDSTDRLEEGLELIRRAHEQDPENPAILDSLGWANYKLDRPERALDYLRRAYRGHQSGEIAAHLGEVLWQQGQRDEARAIWQEALERDGDDPVLQETLERLAPEVLSR